MAGYFIDENGNPIKFTRESTDVVAQVNAIMEGLNSKLDITAANTSFNNKANRDGSNLTSSDVISFKTKLGLTGGLSVSNGSNTWSIGMSGNNLVFYYNGTAKMTLDTNGNIWI